ncbi:MAG: endonuclease MutS2 [Lachnospiraceae bacterium]|jgi:DNA mismatch repair protein MutS2|nr:endonuclease MutS2 [Lachnospiraceae bacterium]
MNAKSLKKLEFDKILDMLSCEASSDLGRAMCESLTPFTDAREISRAQEETAAAFSRIVKKGRVSFGDNFFVEDSLKRLEIGAALMSGELLRICKILENAGRVKQYGGQNEKDCIPDCLSPLFSALSPLSHVSLEIRRCIPSEDEVSGDASSELRRIRRQISIGKDKIHSTLSSMLTGSLKSYLQDSIITVRNDRYCIPVKSEYQSQVSGLIHDRSGSGSTVFIEPMAVVKLNNELKELYGKEQEEIDRIMAFLSQEVSSYISEIRSNCQLLTELDFCFAKGALALSMDASMPELSNDRVLHFKNARHPLLDKKTVVPISVSLGQDYDLLIITGPNTGGKTVTLKTVGLLTLMGQSGLHIPASSTSVLGTFNEIYADIGDEQSIEQSLSTFSSHMTNIVRFINEADEASLVLFDELGAGTDPTEGAALAVSILESLHSKGIRTIATTHYSELKIYALSTPGVENAGCEFDIETLKPTYRLLVGIPGKSNAFAIAGKLGLPDALIEDAKARLNLKDAAFEDVIKHLEEDRMRLERENAAANEKNAILAKRESKLNESLEKSQAQKDAIIREAKEKANELLVEAKAFADEAIRQLNRAQADSKVISGMEKIRHKLREKIAETSEVGVSEKIKNTPAPKVPEGGFKPGDGVLVHSLNVKGIVLSTPDAKGLLTIQMGILQSKFPASDLSLLTEEEENKSAGVTLKKGDNNKATFSKSLTIRPEINLLGKTVDEATAELDKYLDDAYLSHLNPVRIVHGKGTGALRQGIHRYLKNNSHIKSYKLAEFGEGDAGVTVVEFKKT